MLLRFSEQLRLYMVIPVYLVAVSWSDFARFVATDLVHDGTV